MFRASFAVGVLTVHRGLYPASPVLFCVLAFLPLAPQLSCFLPALDTHPLLVWATAGSGTQQ